MLVYQQYLFTPRTISINFFYIRFLYFYVYSSSKHAKHWQYRNVTKKKSNIFLLYFTANTENQLHTIRRLLFISKNKPFKMFTHTLLAHKITCLLTKLHSANIPWLEEISQYIRVTLMCLSCMFVNSFYVSTIFLILISSILPLPLNRFVRSNLKFAVWSAPYYILTFIY